ncbi:Deoxyhypusine hydroxylase [Balamuthia mandrillaris]
MAHYEEQEEIETVGGGLNVTPEEITKIKEMLMDTSLPVAPRFRAVFTLRNIGGELAIDALAEALMADKSALLKHEIAYVLGQMQNPHAIPYLNQVLADAEEDPMVRHEAGEALGAIGDPKSLEVLERFATDPRPEVSETCSLAIDTIKYKLKENKKTPNHPSPYCSVDPAPRYSTDDVQKLKTRLLDESLPLFKRYRAMFALRDIGDTEAVEALAAGFRDSSALFRHEIAYVLGQMAHEHAAPSLTVILKDMNEHYMVRHEAAEALGAIASSEIMPMLQDFCNDKEQVVRESCLVAVDVSDYNTSDTFEYADTLKIIREQAAATVESS